MASGSLPPSSSKSKSEESPGDGVKSYDFLSDTKWWLHQQPKDNSTFWESSWETLKIEEYAKIKEFKTIIGDTSQQAWSQDDHHLLTSENTDKLLSETEPQLNKTEPWWRTVDLNELTSFVSDKPVDCLQPQMNKIGQKFVPDKGLASLDYLTDSMPKSPTSLGMGESHSPCGLDEQISINETEKLQELSKAELLEALCHSQTRAREAEKAAQKAHNEKEDIITHFLKQASHLFAYKQWFHILQLETTCLHLKNNKYHLVYTRFPDFVPPKRVRRNGAEKMKSGEFFGKFILGLTLVGAGLLLGWTLGWLFR